MRTRRHHFATPFVLTVACGGSPAPAPKPAPTWVPPEESRPRTPEAGEVFWDDPGCKKLLDDGTTEWVDCPDELVPEAEPGELVVQPEGMGSCFRVLPTEPIAKWSRGRVKCPADGPNVTLPKQLVITVGRERFRLHPASLTCSQEVMGNPPSWRTVTCPQTLRPRIQNVTPEAYCDYHGVHVCARSQIVARIVDVRADGAGTLIRIAIRGDEGIAKGMTVAIRELPTATIERCDESTCTARIAATPAQVKAARGYALIEE